MYVLLTADPAPDPTETRTDELIAELRDRVRSLDDQLAQERQAHAEARRIIAGLVERIPPAIESPEAPAEDVGSGDVPPRRSWWRRMFGG